MDVFVRYGNGSFAEQMTSSTGIGSSPLFVDTVDFDKDGRLNLASGNSGTSNIGVLYGYGNGTFGNLQTYAIGIDSNPINVNVGDFNNDQQLNIIVGDFNNDSLTDIVAANSATNNIDVLIGDGNGNFSP
jgi:hypothetical protein